MTKEIISINKPYGDVVAFDSIVDAFIYAHNASVETHFNFNIIGTKEKFVVLNQCAIDEYTGKHFADPVDGWKPLVQVFGIPEGV